MVHVRRDEPAQRFGEPCDVLGDVLETKGLDGDESIALRVVGAENRSQDAAADLMQDAVRAEGGRRGEPGGLVERQR
jgi:hypothetical protein